MHFAPTTRTWFTILPLLCKCQCTSITSALDKRLRQSKLCSTIVPLDQLHNLAHKVSFSNLRRSHNNLVHNSTRSQLHQSYVSKQLLSQHISFSFFFFFLQYDVVHSQEPFLYPLNSPSKSL